jgi:hypothetical protein
MAAMTLGVGLRRKIRHGGFGHKFRARGPSDQAAVTYIEFVPPAIYSLRYPSPFDTHCLLAYQI